MGLTRLRAEQISDIDYKQAVRVITVTDITNLSGGAPSQVDGVNLSAGDRILVTAQDPGSENGIYQVQTVGTGSNGTWIRSIDTNQTGELEAGTIVMVTEGNTYADTQWKLTTNNPIIIGTTPLTFVQNSADSFGNIYANGTAILANTVGSALTLTPGNNIEITGNNSTKTVTIAVTGISLNSISNGTSNVNVVSSGGNITVGVGGTANVAEFSTGGLKVTGFVSATGNVTGGNFLTGGLISATSTITSAANIVGGNISTAGLITSTGNITGGNIFTAGTLSAAGNVFGGNALFSGNLTVNGNVTYINSNVVTINDLAINLANNAANASLANGGGIEVGPQGSPYITWLYDSVANTWTSSAGISAVGNISGQNLRTVGLITATGNVTGGNILTAGLISATSTITSVANILGGNILTSGLISATGSLTAGNILGGNLLTSGIVSATGNALAGNISTSGIVTAAGNVTGGNILTAGLITATGAITGANITGGNLITSGLLTASGNLTGGNILTAGLVSSTGNVTGGNILTLGQVSATGNVTGNFFIGNGAFLTGLQSGAANGIANGSTNITIPVASGNIAMSVQGQSNTVVISLGTFSMYGTFATPKLLQSNVQIAPDTNAVLFGPVEVDPAYNITVPDDSTLYIIGSL
jgi:filamentous hemagglutinin